ncbi:MAG TPA: MFS transporter [Casimicrobiaceae bacterium]|nr:MFS transporter [Casimicrobiaceae bacterium]
MPAPEPTASTRAVAPAATSAFAPLRHPTFRMLWIVWMVANVSMWMNDVATAWVMTSLTSSPTMVALVQTAATLPVFLLGLPTGALADIVDRRRFLIFTQVWSAVVATLTCLAILADTLSPALLLFLMFLNGIALAMRWPVYAAIVPEIVPRPELSAALALNGVGMNLSRVIGPVVAGALIAGAGSAYVFVLNAGLSIFTATWLLRWKREQKTSTLPSEHIFGAIRVGLQHVRQSPHIQSVMLRVFVFFLQSIALLALLPLIARRFEGGDANTFTILLAAMGGGAIITALGLPRLRRVITRDELVRNGTLLHAAATLVMAFSPNLWVAVPAMMAAGMAWISVTNSLTVAAQMGLPDWVRARGMSIVQMSIMGGTAIGAAVWGQVASLTSVRTSLVLAAACALASIVLLRRYRVGGRAEEDLTPAGVWTTPELAIPVEPEQGPVLVTVEYHIDPARKDDFVALMRESRRIWLSNGLLAWELFHDVADAGHYIEHLIDESWAEYVRRNERVTSAYYALREQKLAFHVRDEAPILRRFVAERVRRA